MEAYDVLSDDEQRAVYDRLRAAAKANGGASLRAPTMRFSDRPLTAEEAEALKRGLQELAAMKRAAVGRQTKHGPLDVDLPLSLHALYTGYVSWARAGLGMPVSIDLAKSYHMSRPIYRSLICTYKAPACRSRSTGLHCMHAQ